MVLKWEQHAGVYCAIVDGSLSEVGDKFTDEELRPFLPLLASYLSHPSPSTSRNFLSKICSLAMKSGLMPYLTLDYQYIGNNLVCQKKSDGFEGFADLDPTQRLTALCRALQKEEFANPDEWLLPCLCEENMEELGWMLSFVLLNMPNIISIEDLVMKLLSLKDGSELLTQLVALNPPLSHSILDRMAEMRKECMFATRVVCERLDDEAVCCFLRTHLLDRKGQISTLIGKSATKHTAAVVLNRLLNIISVAVSKQSTEPLTDVLLSIIYLYHRCGMKLPPSDLTLITSFICRRNIAHEGHLTTALAALIATPTLTFSTSVPVALSYQVESHISAWLEWIRTKTENGFCAAFARDLLNVGLGVVAGRSDIICAYFAEILKLPKVVINQRQMEQWKTLFTNSCLSEADLTTRCTSLPITLSLSSSSGNRLPIHVMAELMTANAFTKYNVDISSVFSGDLLDDEKLAARVLVLLYLLCYKRKVDAAKEQGVYQSDVYMRLPIRYLLSVMEVRYNDFVKARCHLIHLVTELFPHMLPTIDSITIAKSRRAGIRLKDDVMH
ncbi:unnamed protein product [Angiostrongylus costaricensis]|uniref:NopRA1 domain-containing protein n=1 Tax=Angiostrongylus costaricensis TaxID=334426 RepID=A0A158PFR9_ANGCS|nr:unnamed protein product [Angiostrongylus costaricensis]